MMWMASSFGDEGKLHRSVICRDRLMRRAAQRLIATSSLLLICALGGGGALLRKAAALDRLQVIDGAGVRYGPMNPAYTSSTIHREAALRRSRGAGVMTAPSARLGLKPGGFLKEAYTTVNPARLFLVQCLAPRPAQDSRPFARCLGDMRLDCCGQPDLFRQMIPALASFWAFSDRLLVNVKIEARRGAGPAGFERSERSIPWLRLSRGRQT